MEKINELTSENIVQQNIERLKEIFPTAFAEGKLVVEELQALVGEYIEQEKEFYQMTWAGKTQAKKEANKVSTGTLRPNKADSKDWDTTGNIFIEGDNLEVLKLLQKTYSNKIKMIYIDPPYNTGKDFVYKDNYKDNLANYLELTGQTDDEGKKRSTNTDSDGRYHSNWLNMMYPRLKLARNLMTDDGVIFISIDDKELHNLIKICNEIFGEENFRGLLTRPTGTPAGGGNDVIVNEVDYILVFSKSKDSKIKGLELSKDEMKIYDLEDEYGIYLKRSLRRTGGEDRREDRPTMFYPIIAPDGSEIFPIGPTGYESRWICGKDNFDKMLKDNLISIEKNSNGKWQVFQKFYLEGRVKQPSNLLKNIEGNKKGTREVRQLFDSIKVFDFPKPTDLLKHLLKFIENNNFLVFDFFAGSASTAHAVMALNAEDGGNRKCISVQLPEPTDEKSEAYKAGYKTIAEITKERIRRAGELIKQENKDKENIDNLDVGFRAFKLDSSNIRAWDTSVDQFEDQLDLFLENNGDSIKSDRTEEDVLFEILLKYGLELTLPIQEKQVNNCTIYNIGFGAMYICLNDKITVDVAKAIAEWHKESADEKPSVIFKDAGFANDADKTNTVQTLRQSGIENVKSI